MATVIVGKTITYVLHPFGCGALTSDGVQYCTAVATTTADTNVNVEPKTVALTSRINVGGAGTLKEIELGLTCAVKTNTSNTATLSYTWQAKNNIGATWVDLFPFNTLAAPLNAAYADKTWSGRIDLSNANCNKMPLDVKLIFQCNAANEGLAKTKNSSYVMVSYEID